MSQVESPVEEKAPAPDVAAKKTKVEETQPSSTGEPQEKPKSDPETEEFKKAVAQAVRDQFKVTDAWMPREVVKFVVNCPSGQSVLVKHLDTLDLIRADLVEDLDSFQRKLFPSELDDQGRPVETNAGKTFFQQMSNPEQRVKFLDTTARLITVSAVKPKVINDGVALVDRELYQKIFGSDLEDGEEKREVFGYQVENIDAQIKLFGKPVPVLKDGEAYAGVIGLPDRFTFFTELNKPLELIAPFREPSESLSDLAAVQANGDSTE